MSNKKVQLFFFTADAEPQKMKNPYKIGKNYFIRTITNYYTGKLVVVYENELVLENCSWIADTGRFQQALKNEEFKEVELFPKGQVIIGRGSILDATIIKKLPNKQR